MRTYRLAHRFVESFPEPLEPGVLYVSLGYASMAHACACGCEEEVITPLSPAGWQMTFDGKTVSVSPSIGNTSLACRSHYWIERGEVDWLDDMTQREVAYARWHGRRVRDAYYARIDTKQRGTSDGVPAARTTEVSERSTATISCHRGTTSRWFSVVKWLWRGAK